MSELQLDNSSHWFYYLLRLFERFIEIRECSDNLPRICALSKRDQPKSNRIEIITKSLKKETSIFKTLNADNGK